MTAILLIAVAVLVILAGWASGRLTRSRRTRNPRVGQYSANPLFWLIGLVTFGVGLLAVINGIVRVADASDHPDPFGVASAESQAEAFSLIAWGAVILTVGAYVWRGARRRGARDRFGRLLIIVGYLLLGVALRQTIHSAFNIGAAAQSAQEPRALDPTLVQFLGWGAPAALLVFIGTKMADEKVLMTASVDV